MHTSIAASALQVAICSTLLLSEVIVQFVVCIAIAFYSILTAPPTLLCVICPDLASHQAEVVGNTHHHRRWLRCPHSVFPARKSAIWHGAVRALVECLHHVRSYQRRSDCEGPFKRRTFAIALLLWHRCPGIVY